MKATRDTFDLRAYLGQAASVIERTPIAGEVPGSFEQFVLDHGEPFTSKKLTRAEHAAVDDAMRTYRLAFKAFRPRECFGNSQHLMFFSMDERLVYVEGFAWTHSLRAVLHGWLVINGKVIDVTLPPTTRREALRKEPYQALGEFSGRSYMGVRFEHSYVEHRRRVTGDVGSLLDDEAHGYPLLGAQAPSARAAVERARAR